MRIDTVFSAVVLLVASNAAAVAQQSFSDDLLLVGLRNQETAETSSIRCLSRDGKLGREIYRTDEGRIASGRLDRSRTRFAMTTSTSNASKLWIVTPAGNATSIADMGPMILAWSPDARFLAVSDVRGSFQLNVSEGTTSQIELPVDYVVDDWHPTKEIRLAVFQNPRNQIYREFRGDRYPARQIDLILKDGTTEPVTRNPSSDNIWGRFSPDGRQIAHYQRVIDNEVPHETLVVCNMDGTNPQILVDLRKVGTAIRFPWYRPKGHPVWSPDGRTIAWIVNSNERLTGDGEKFEILFVDVATRKLDRIPLADQGVTWVSQIEW